MLGGLRSHDITMIVFQFTVKCGPNLLGYRQHLFERILVINRRWQGQEQADTEGAETVHIIQVERAGIEDIGDTEYNRPIIVISEALVKNPHPPKFQPRRN